MTKALVISGKIGEILARQKSEKELELGELLVAESDDIKVLLQVFDLCYGSQISQQNLELISGLKLEENTEMEFLDPHLRNYIVAKLKALVTLKNNNAKISKILPSFFSELREVNKDDLSFLTMPKNPLFLGRLRSGSKELNVDIALDGVEVLSHHILIPAMTGRGKSNLMSVILWDTLDKDYCGLLVLDPHDEYYGRNSWGLKDHPAKERVSYYTPNNPPPGAKTLKINIEVIKPEHFQGAVEWSQPQKEALNAFFREYGNKWIEAILLDKPLKIIFNEGTLGVVKRRVMSLLSLDISDAQCHCRGVFDLSAGKTTIEEISSKLEEGKTVVVDTSCFSGAVEILVGSMITKEVFRKYKNYQSKGLLKDKPVISIVLEEAPRVLGKEVLEKGPNVFSSIAREGRKFKVGLIAITQLPSLIPRQILANMNTKIILGIEMAPERTAIIESASQDLSDDSRNIASLDKGEAIITSNFAKFATPIKIPLFKDFVVINKSEVKKDFSSVI